jgi:hypothetical protein
MSLDSKKLEAMLAAARKRPELEALEWGSGEDGFEAPVETEALSPRTIAALVESDPKTYDARRTRIRDRYIGVRFEGIARSAADLEDPKRVIKAARLAFEEGAREAPLELLELSIEQNPHDESLWLAELEISFLQRDAARFVNSARGFHVSHPESKAWPDVLRLGRSIAPEESLFEGRSAPRAQDHYGPWPDMPNWIQASWDLTAEVIAADFHRAMTGPEEEAADHGAHDA